MIFVSVLSWFENHAMKSIDLLINTITSFDNAVT